MTGLSVPCQAVVRVSVSLAAEHLCPFKPERDHGTVAISWITSRGETIELHALAGLVSRHRDTEISHEQWTADLYSALVTAVAVDELSISSSWTTAGATVTVNSVDAAVGEP